jgi:hypothetical protein
MKVKGNGLGDVTLQLRPIRINDPGIDPWIRHCLSAGQTSRSWSETDFLMDLVAADRPAHSGHHSPLSSPQNSGTNRQHLVACDCLHLHEFAADSLADARLLRRFANRDRGGRLCYGV